MPVDRVYIERFLERQRDLIVGDVLEVRQAYYTTRFGSRGVRSHVLDIDASNPAATVLGDLCDVATLPEEAYDCAILTQTLQFVADPQAALRNLWRSLRAGGALLLTVPCAARIDHELAQSDYWRWTPAGLRKLVEHCCEGALVEVEAGGNLVVAMAALLGLAAEDLSPDDVGSDDPVFPVIACVAALKL